MDYWDVQFMAKFVVQQYNEDWKVFPYRGGVGCGTTVHESNKQTSDCPFFHQPFLIHSLHSTRAEVGSSSDQSANYSGKTILVIFLFYSPVYFNMK